MPLVLRIDRYCVFFWSNEGKPIHIHVAEGNPAPSVAKIWITRAGHCYLRSNSLRIPERALRNIMRLLESHQEEIVEVNRKQQLGGVICSLYERH